MCSIAAVGGPASEGRGKAKKSAKAVSGDFVESATATATAPFDPAAVLDDQDMTLENMERIMIKKLLEDLDGNKPQVADKLGVSLKTLYNKIRKYGL